MRSWRTVAVSGLASVALTAVGSPVRAEDPPGSVTTGAEAGGDPAARPAQRVGYAALPGGLHVAAAEALPPGTVELALVSGYGYRKGLLAEGHTFNRAIGQLAVGYSPVANLALALSLDGRYDKHDGFGSKTDDGYVGDPHLLIRYAQPLGKAAIGGQLGIWVPGKDAPSIAASATSVDARALVSYDAGFGALSVNAGFRLDNSAKSVDQPMALSPQDQVSLGVSKFNAAVAGAALRVPLGARAYVGVEASADAFVGSGAPGSILRAGGMFGVALNDAVSIVGYVEGARGPSVSYGAIASGGPVPLVPYEPVITGGLGLQARFGGVPRRPATDTVVAPTRVKTPVVVVETADVLGSVVDETGKPVVGARVTVRLKNNQGTTATDDKGGFAVSRLPIGKTVDGKTELDDTGAELAVEVANKKPASATLTLAKGTNNVPRIALDPLLPPGQLRAVIINVGNSRPVPGATVQIEPGGVTATSGADGKFTVDLPPGHYRITVTAKGLAQQQLDVNIDPNGVAIKNIDMHK
jgi:hypothetical protein